MQEEQRSRYKHDFNKEFTEYQQLHDRIKLRIQMFRELTQRLEKEEEGTAEYEVSIIESSLSICKQLLLV